MGLRAHVKSINLAVIYIYVLNVVNRIDKTSTPYQYRGEDCMDTFIEQLGNIKSDITEK